MNRSVTHFAEKLIELGYSIRTARTPNPFRIPNEEQEKWLAADLDDFYAVQDCPPDLKFIPLAEAKGEHLARFYFPSSVTSPHPQNNTVYGLADLHRPAGGETGSSSAAAAIIFLHGHMMTRTTLFPLLLHSRVAVRAGFDIYYMNLPYHLLRAPKGTYSGQHSLNADIPGAAFAFMQGVKDVRSLITWIEHERHIPVIVAGVSLGAYTACMTAAVDHRPRAVISILGGASLARIHWDGYRRGKIWRQLSQGGVTPEQHERWWALLSPGKWRPHLEPDRILMVGAQHDATVTPSNVHALWEAWDKPQILWVPSGHVTSALYHRQISAVLSDFVECKIL